MSARPKQNRPAHALVNRSRLATFAGRAALVVFAAVLVLAMPLHAGKKSYGYDEDPVRRGDAAFKEGKLADAAALYKEAIENEWKLDRAQYGLAEVLRREEKFTEAEPIYRAAIAEHEETRNTTAYPEANAGLGLTLLALGRPDEAQKEFTTALGEDKNNWNANYGTARILISQKRYSDALPYLEKGKNLKDVSEGLDQYNYAMALAEVGLEDWTAAEKYAMLALTLNPSVAEYGTLVAQIYTQRGAPTLAIDAYERALATPGVVPTPRVHQDLAVLYEGERQFNDALRHYLDAIEMDSTFAPAYKSAARLYALGNQNDRAGRFYLRYTELVPNDAEGWYGQAEAFLSLNSNKRALEAAQKAYDLDSTDAKIRLSLARATYSNNDLSRSAWMYTSVPDTTLYTIVDWVNLGQIALSQKGFDRADELLTKAIAMDPTYADAYTAKAKLFLTLPSPKPDSAVVYYQKSLELNPKSVVAKVNLGVAYLQLRRPADASAVLRQVIAVNPNWAPAHVYLGQALVMSDSLSSALGEYRRALEIDPNNASAMRGAGFVYLKRKDYGQAETILLKATEADPRSADGWASLGSAQSGLNKIDEGIASFEKALEISPNHEGALRGLEALKQAKATAGG